MKSLFFLLVVFVISSDYSYHLLKDRRDNVTFVDYSRDQKIAVAASIRNLFEIFVHRKVKMQDFGNDVDPLPKLDNIIKKLGDQVMSNEQFHYQISDIFWSMRDFHTKYAFPGPHKCYSWLQPLSFALDDKNSVIVSTFALQPEVLKLSGIIDTQVAIGDELLEINGVSVPQYVALTSFKSGGANDFVAFRTGLDYMVSRDGGVHQIPETNNQTYTLRSRLTGLEYQASFPWISVEYGYCLNANLNPNASAIGEIAKTQFHNDLHKSSFLSRPFKFNDTVDPIVKWGTYRFKNKTLGILRIVTFVGGESTVQIIKNLLLNELNQTFALLIDLRSNPGGSLLLAEKLPQLFAPNITTTNFKALVNDINKQIFLNATDPTDPWHQSYLKVNNGDEFTPLTTFTNDSVANSIMQSYFNPLAIFTDGHCYSSCDMFSAALQDNVPGLVVFGEDQTTGGGGANVGTWSYLGKRNPTAFPKFPYRQNNQVTQFATVAWRQAIRVKGENGNLIEGRGVKSDYIIRPNYQDFKPEAEFNSQYEEIIRKLAYLQ